MHAIQQRMDDRAVQAFVVVLHDQLPVGAHVVFDALHHPQIRHRPGSKAGRKIAELRAQRRLAPAEVDEDVPVPHLARDAMKREVVAREPVDGVHLRRADQPSIQIVGPAVIRTLDAAGKGAGAGVTERVPR